MLPDIYPTAETASQQLKEQLAEHSRIMGWLARLDSAPIDAPASASDQVRADYIDRLSRLAATVVQRAEQIRVAMTAAAQRITDARDRIPELRVRHAVGELDDAALTQHLSILKRDAAEAELERSRLAALLPEADAAIEQLRASGTGTARVPPRVEATTSGQKPSPRDGIAMDDAFGEWQAPTEPSARAGAEDDDLSFLNALPLSRTPVNDLSEAPAEASAPAPAPPPPQPSVAPAGASLVCRMCGGSSAATAWYCERCGAELS